MCSEIKISNNDENQDYNQNENENEDYNQNEDAHIDNENDISDFEL